jgi:hypothetical protein
VPTRQEQELLAQAAELIAQGWCQRALAEDRFGREVLPWSEGACRWSPLGALTRVSSQSGRSSAESFEVAYTALSLATGGRPEDWNAAPWRTRRHVLSAFVRAREFLPEARDQLRIRGEAQRSSR